jgi:serine/threonine protein kinase
MTLDAGTLLHSRYRIAGLLGKGGMGAIYHAVDESLGVEVAVKENLNPTEEYSRQFHKEANILASLRHSNLPRVTDHFVIEGQGQYLVMDYIAGEDLRQRMTRLGKLPESDVILIGIAICDALNYLHSLPSPILHRDIKPGNIKITPTGQVFLVDFGLAKVFQSNQATTIGAQAYTPGFAPPEQYGKGTDQRSDIYSLGATLYAAISGAVPEDGLSRLMQTAELTSLRATGAEVSEGLANVIEKAMAIEPNSRFQTAAEFKQALLAVNTTIRRKTADDSAITITPPPPQTIPASPVIGVGAGLEGRTPTPRPASQPKSQPARQTQPKAKTALLFGLGGLGILILGIIGVAAVIGVAYYAGFIVFETSEPTPVVQANAVNVIVDITSTPMLDITEPITTVAPPVEFSPTTGPTEAPTQTPAASVSPGLGGGTGEIAFASDRSGKPQIWVINTDGKQLRQITDVQDGACQPDWSPDGSQIVFSSPCESIAPKGFERNAVYKHKNVFSHSALFVINYDGSNLRPLFSSTGGDSDPAWSPDGATIAFTSVRDIDFSRIFLYDIDSKETSLVSRVLTCDDFYPEWAPDGKRLAFTTMQTGSPNVFTMDLMGGERRPLIRDTAHFFMPSWSPKEETIMFSISDPMPQIGSKKVNAVGKDFKAIKEGLAPVYDVDYSPDGDWLAYEHIKDNVRDIYIMMTSGTGLKNITNDEYNDYGVAWRPLPKTP